MRIMSWFIQTVFTLVSAVATYLPLWANYRGWNMWGLAWQIWAMIGFTVFWVSVGSIVWRLQKRIKVLENKNTELAREERKLNIKNAKLDFWIRKTQYNDTLPPNLREELEE